MRRPSTCRLARSVWVLPRTSSRLMALMRTNNGPRSSSDTYLFVSWLQTLHVGIDAPDRLAPEACILRVFLEKGSMPRLALVVLALVAISSLALAQGRPTRFWNLTRDIISEFYLSPAGASAQAMPERQGGNRR